MQIFPSFNNFNQNSSILLKNCGFESDFFNKLDENIISYKNNNINNINIYNNIKKIKSENDISSLNIKRKRLNNERKIYEAEDKDIYNKMYEYNIKNFYKTNNNSASYYTTFTSKDYLEKNKNSCEIIKNNNYIIKAYKSKLKKKYNKLYELNSINLQEKNKFKLYHKCCYPGCNRTFSSSGWLKSHLNKHLRQIHNSKYCKLFQNYILTEKINNNNIIK